MTARKPEAFVRLRTLKSYFGRLTGLETRLVLLSESGQGFVFVYGKNEIENHSDDLGNVIKWDRFKSEGVKL
jgi:hypothetical protein